MKLFGFQIQKISREPDFKVPEDIDEEYSAQLKQGKRLILGTLVARSGTRWLCDIFSAHENATGVTERYVVAEAFYRYVTYHKLPVDTSGIISLIKYGIVKDWEKADVSLVFSPYFSHGILNLVNELNPEQVILGVADPKFTVQSIYNKGVFSNKLFYKNKDLVIGYQPDLQKPSHFFGRVIPQGVEFEEWEKLSRIGKISWWGNRIMTDINEQVQQLPQSQLFIFNLPDADQNYAYYRELAQTFQLSPVLSEKQFLAIKGKSVKANDNMPHVWSMQENKEFEHHTKNWRTIYDELIK